MAAWPPRYERSAPAAFTRWFEACSSPRAVFAVFAVFAVLQSYSTVQYSLQGSRRGQIMHSHAHTLTRSHAPRLASLREDLERHWILVILGACAHSSPIAFVTAPHRSFFRLSHETGGVERRPQRSPKSRPPSSTAPALTKHEIPTTGLLSQPQYCRKCLD